MLGRRPILGCVALSAALGIAAPALSQDVVAPCSLCEPTDNAASEKPDEPVRLQVEASLDFDRLILGNGGNGSAELGPDGSRIVTGAVTAISSRAMVGQLTIRGEPGRSVRIDLPQSAELFGFNGGSIRLESIRSDLPAMPRLDGNGRLNFRFGGIVHVTGDLDGDYRGDVRVQVEYF